MWSPTGHLQNAPFPALQNVYETGSSPRVGGTGHTRGAQESHKSQETERPLGVRRSVDPVSGLFGLERFRDSVALSRGAGLTNPFRGLHLRSKADLIGAFKGMCIGECK
jgi:hypothetical protein